MSDSKSTNTDEFIETFQNSNIEENDDQKLLNQQKIYFESKLMEREDFNRQLEILYTQIDKTKNYQELIDGLTNCKHLLTEIFTTEGQLRRSEGQHHLLDIDWDKYGVDMVEFIANNEELLSLYSEGKL